VLTTHVAAHPAGQAWHVFDAKRPEATESTGDWPAGWWLRALAPGEQPGATAPVWADFLQAALRSSRPDPGNPVGQLGRPWAAAADDEQLFAPVVRPLLLAAEGAFDDGFAGVSVAAGALQAARSSWSQLTARLCRTMLRTLLTELHQRSGGRPDGRAHLDDLLRERGTIAGLRALLVDRPVLARRLGIQCVNHVAAVSELVHRLTADLPAIRRFAALSAVQAEVSELQIGSGDVHRGGRSVAVVCFTDGGRIVYKPRPGQLQAHLGPLLAWYQRQLPNWAPRLPRTLVRAGYCWEEFITAQPCQDSDAVERFYRRQGTLLALLYVLGCTDVHYENVIAHGEQPLVIDIETAFHPLLTSDRLRADPAVGALAASVVRVGLLPMMVEGDDRRADVSGLTGGLAGMSPHEVPMLTAAGTDGMRLERRPVPLAAAANRPELAGVRVDPVEFRLALLTGFRTGYQVLAAQPNTVRTLIDSCRDDEVRVVLRDTYLYAAVLDESSHPDLLLDPADHDRFLRRVSELSDNAAFATLVDGEVAQLWQCDVPLMVTTPTATTIRSATGIGTAPVSESAMERTAATLAQMSARDLRLQEWIIDASLATTGPRLRHRAVPCLAVGGAEDGGPDRLIAQACGLADELCAIAHDGDRRSNWLGLEPSDGSLWSLAPLGASLGDGYLGVALFLHMTYRITGIQRYFDTAARAVAGLPTLLAGWIDDEDAAHDIGGGALDGLGGIAWVLAHLTRPVNGSDPLLPPSTLDQALVLCGRLLADGVAALPPGDVADGLAGLTVTMRAVAASSVPATAAASASQLVQLAAEPTAPVSGVRAGGAHYRAGQADDVSWCSGLAGRLVTAELDSATVLRGITTLAEFGPLGDHAPCHGEVGVLEALDILVRRGVASAEQVLRKRVTGLLGAIASGGPQCAAPGAVRTPGFRYGLSGIGYGLLRLADPDTVPSVLMFDAATDRLPQTHNRPSHQTTS
jgi:type 2 lantibiotic biosynthesis protein LanM